MSDEKSQPAAWSMFKEAAIFVSMLLGMGWLILSSALMLITVLRAIFH